MRFLRYFILGALLAVPSPALAVDAGAGVRVLPPTVVSAPAEVAPAPPASVPSAADVVGKGEVTAGAVRDAIALPTWTSILTAVSAGLFFVITIARRWGPLVGMSGNTIRILVLAAGAVATGLSGFVAGVPWMQALQMVFAAGGSVLIAEALKLFKRKPAGG